MSNKSPKVDLNIYLAKPEVNSPAQIIKDVGALTPFNCYVGDMIPCTLFVQTSRSSPPPWARFFASAIPITAFGKNSSTGAALYIRVKSATLVATFGRGHHLVDTSNIEMNFGLRTALNMLDAASIRSIDKASFEEHPTQTREQVGVATELQYFGVNIERDLLRAITGRPLKNEFGARVSGKDAIKLHVDVTLETLTSLLGKPLRFLRAMHTRMGRSRGLITLAR